MGLEERSRTWLAEQVARARFRAVLRAFGIRLAAVLVVLSYVFGPYYGLAIAGIASVMVITVLVTCKRDEVKTRRLAYVLGFICLLQPVWIVAWVSLA